MKLLIVGGAHQNKLEYACRTWSIQPEELEPPSGGPAGRVVLNHLHRTIREMLERGENPAEGVDRLLCGAEEWIVLCDEIGCGIVPVEEADRRWREETGRICCRLAEQADRVERIHCGIAGRIKG